MSNRSAARVVGGLLMGGLIGTTVAGEINTLGPLQIDTPWARASIGTARPGAAYVTIRNTGDEADRLVSIETPLAARLEVHAMAEAGGVMKMRPAGPLEIPPGEEVRLEPGGMHIMLMQLQAPLEEGDQIPVTFAFENAGEITVNVAIGGVGARKPPQ